MRIFHVATRADWEEGVRRGAYTTSTRGRTLAEEGFIHAARADQWQGVRRRYYADVAEPLVLLVIDAGRLGAPVVEESVPGGETFPHVYGVIEPDAVVQVLPLDEASVAPAPAAGASAPARRPVPDAGPAAPATPAGSFLQVMLREMVLNMVLVVLVVALAGALGVLGARVVPSWGGPVGLAVGVALGGLAARALYRRRR